MRRSFFIAALIFNSLVCTNCARIKNVFDISSFMPHGFCLHWDPTLIATMVVSNLGIAAAYFAIPVALWHFVRHKKNLPYPWMFRLFGMFIIACGITHLMKIWTFYQPFYWLEATADAYTAGVSLLTAVLLWPLIPKALALKSPQELEEADKKLQQSTIRGEKAEKKFRALLESAPDAIVIVNQSTKIVLANSQAEKLFGYTRDEMVGQTIDFLLPQNHQPQNALADGFFAQSNTKSSSAGLEVYALSKSGKKFPIEISLRPIETEDGLLVFSAIRDISERKQVLLALQESEERFRLLVSGVKDYAIFMLDRKGMIQTWNYGAERIIGYKENEIIGKHFSCFYSEEGITAGRPAQELDTAVETGRFEEEGLRRRKDGSYFWANVVLVPLFDNSGEVTGFAKVTRDITERKLIIDKLQEQAELLNLTHDAVIVRNLDGTIHYWNYGAKEMYGYTAEEAVGKITHALLNTKFPQPFEEIEQEILSKGYWEGEIVHETRTAQKLIVSSRHILKRNAQGQPSGILEINTDITTHKQAEQRQATLAEMKRVNAELEQFASVASHDLQEPLRAVAGCLQILEKSYKGKLDNSADELINHAVDGAVRMRTLINDLLSLSRVNSSYISLEPTDLNKVLEDILKSLELNIKEAGAIITHDELPVITVEKTQLAQLFQNLISNAIKYSGDNPAEIHVGASDQGNNQWQIYVRDNGIGFDQEHAEKIFQPFKRLHGRDKYPGTGIGLAICKRIVERHGGEIWAKSECGKGTIFYFTITDLGK